VDGVEIRPKKEKNMTTRKPALSRVEAFARKAPSLEGVSIELALSSLYDPTTGTAVASREALAQITHYSEKRVRTLTKGLVKSGRWNVTSDHTNAPKTFSPVL